MNIKFLSLLAATALLFAACGDGEKKDDTKGEADDTDKKEMNDETSMNDEKPEVPAEEMASTNDGYQIGSEVEDFELKNVDGEMVSMADYPDAKGFIIIFSCNHCPYVIGSEDRMIELDKRYKEKGYPVIAINSNDTEQYPADSYENMVKRAEEKGFTFPYVIDETQEVARRFGATRTPHVYVLGREEGSLKVKYIGAIDDSPKEESGVTETYLDNAMQAIMKGETPDPSTTKSIGCSIKYKA